MKDAIQFDIAFPDRTFDIELPSLDFNGYDVVALFFGDELLDVYGVIGADGADEPWAFPGQSAARDVLVTTPRTTMLQSEWAIGSAFTPDSHVHP